MNERIKQLYNQAAVYAKNKYTLPEEIMDFAYCVPEKFAELLLQECIALGTNFTNRNYSEDAGERIAKNFGIEEN